MPSVQQTRHLAIPLRSENGFVQATLIVIILLILAAVITLDVISYRQQEAQLASLSADVSALELRLSRVEQVAEGLGRKISLDIQGVQKIDNVFLISKIKVKKYLTGVRVTGLMINASSLVQNDARFRITINDVSREFTVKRISPGSSSRFSVDLPNINPAEATEAEVRTLGASVSYYVD